MVYKKCSECKTKFKSYKIEKNKNEEKKNKKCIDIKEIYECKKCDAKMEIVKQIKILKILCEDDNQVKNKK